MFRSGARPTPTLVMVRARSTFRDLIGACMVTSILFIRSRWHSEPNFKSLRQLDVALRLQSKTPSSKTKRKGDMRRKSESGIVTRPGLDRFGCQPNTCQSSSMRPSFGIHVAHLSGKVFCSHRLSSHLEFGTKITYKHLNNIWNCKQLSLKIF